MNMTRAFQKRKLIRNGSLLAVAAWLALAAAWPVRADAAPDKEEKTRRYTLAEETIGRARGTCPNRYLRKTRNSPSWCMIYIPIARLINSGNRHFPGCHTGSFRFLEQVTRPTPSASFSGIPCLFSMRGHRWAMIHWPAISFGIIGM